MSNITATIYNPQSGEILFTIGVSTLDGIELNLPEGAAFIFGRYDSDQFYVHNNEPVPLPPKPGEWAVWSGTEWVDPRSPEEIEAEINNALADKRALARLPKLNFILAAITAGIITVEEGKQAAWLEIPASFEGVISSLPQEQRDYARIMWAGAQNIYRMDPLILAVAQLKGITDEQLDALFGVVT